MTISEHDPVLERTAKDEPLAPHVTHKEEVPDEIEQAQHIPLAEKTYPAWSTVLTVGGLFVLGSILLFYIF